MAQSVLTVVSHAVGMILNLYPDANGYRFSTATGYDPIAAGDVTLAAFVDSRFSTPAACRRSSYDPRVTATIGNIGCVVPGTTLHNVETLAVNGRVMNKYVGNVGLADILTCGTASKACPSFDALIAGLEKHYSDR